jgi:hypothetical protein
MDRPAPSDLVPAPATALPALDLPSAGPDPLPWDTALAAGVAEHRGRRPLRFRSPDHPEGRWYSVQAFGFERFDTSEVSSGDPGDGDVLLAEGLHGRLDPAGWTAVRRALDDVRPLTEAAVSRAAGTCGRTCARATAAWRPLCTASCGRTRPASRPWKHGSPRCSPRRPAASR